jgi:HD-like signal output (HDOD) protein
MQDSSDNFKKKLMEIDEISTLPHVMVRIMEIITDENSCAADLGSEIAKDASLTVKILKMVNSAYYGFYREIAKVSDAVVVLGFNEIRRLSLAISVLDMFIGKDRKDHRLRFWAHSFGCAAMSDILAKDSAVSGTGAFTAGLLHDIGIAVLDQYFPAMFSKIQACMNERSLREHEAEQFLYGFDHGDIGYWLSERWNLPINLSEAIRYHHNPALANEAPQLAQLIHVADILTNEFMKTKAEDLSPTETGDVQEVFPPDKKEEVFRELEKRIKDSTFMNIFV